MTYKKAHSRPHKIEYVEARRDNLQEIADSIQGAQRKGGKEGYVELPQDRRGNKRRILLPGDVLVRSNTNVSVLSKSRFNALYEKDE